MIYAVSGQDSAVTFDLMVEGDLVVPNPANVAWKLIGPAGVMTTGTIATDAVTTRVSVPVPAIYNVQTQPYELRNVELAFTAAGRTHKRNQTYRVIPQLLIPVQPSEVRAYFGLSPSELPDDEIDLVQAYFDVQETLFLDLAAVFTAGTSLVARAIRAIKLQAAINVVGSIDLRALNKEQGDNAIWQRFSEIDFEGIRARLGAEYASLVNELVTPAAQDYTISIVARPATDAITGA